MRLGPFWLVVLVLPPIVALLALPPFGQRMVVLVGIYALMGLGYQLVFGQLGALNLAQGALFGLGAYAAVLDGNSVVRSIYGSDQISERHRHRYEVNAHYKAALEAGGLVFSGMSPDGELPEIVERPDHPWFIGVQSHPELKSKPFDPHPLFASFIEAAVKQSRLV